MSWLEGGVLCAHADRVGFAQCGWLLRCDGVCLMMVIAM